MATNIRIGASEADLLAATVLASSTGAVAAARFVGGTTSGAPVAGTFAVGDFIIDQTGTIYICTVAGSPGTWVAVTGGAGSTGPAGPPGADGEDGADGAMGPPGATGAAGATGATGAAGAAGVAGPPGLDGEDGVEGAPGVPGKDAAPARMFLWTTDNPIAGVLGPLIPVQFNGPGATLVTPLRVRAVDYGYGTMTINLLRSLNTLPNPSFTTLLTSDLTVEASHICCSGVEDVVITLGAVASTALAADDILRQDFDSTAAAIGVTVEATVSVP